MGVSRGLVLLTALLLVACKARTDGAAVKVVGGEAVTSDGFDFVVGLAEKDSTTDWYTVFCTGTAVTAKVIVTAAHCLEDLIVKNGVTPDLSKYKIMIGNSIKDKEHVTLFDLAGAVRHEGYEPTDTDTETILKNDVGVVTLASALPDTVVPVPIWTSGFKLGRFLQDNKADEAEIIELVGYGKTGANDVGTGEKRRVMTNIQADSALSFDQIIIGNTEHDACKGDSGGPVFATLEGTRYLIATISGATDFIKNPAGEKIYIICRGKTRTMRMAAYWQWIAQAAAISIPKAP